MAVQQQTAPPPQSLQPPRPTNILDCLEWAVAVANALLQCAKAIQDGGKVCSDPGTVMRFAVIADGDGACNIDATGCIEIDPNNVSMEDLTKGLDRLIVYLNAVVTAYERRA